MLPFEIGSRGGADLDDHCRRVSTLATRAARLLKLPANIVAALEVAAEMHHAWRLPMGLLPANPAAEQKLPSGRTDSATLGLARRIFEAATERREPEPKIGLAGDLLAACNSLDEAAEFAAFEGASLAEALSEFREDCLREHSVPVAASLMSLIAPFRIEMGTARLPVVPKTATELLRTPEDALSPAHLAKFAAADPVLAARLIGVANSSYYGSGASIVRFTDAVMRVGVPVARKAMIAAAFGGLFASPVLREIWRHSQGAAAAAYELAAMAGPDRDTAWLGGLLHDVGRLAFESQSAASRVVEMEWLKGGMPTEYAETLTYGEDHAAVGAKLLRGWGLPEEIASAVELHHRPERAESELAAIISLAEEWCAVPSLSKVAGAESLSREFRRMAALRCAGLPEDALERLNHRSELFALAG